MSDAIETSPTTVDEARETVERARAELTETLESLTDKLDIKKQANAKAHEARVKVRQSTENLARLAKAHRRPVLLGAVGGLAALVAAVRWRRS